MNKYIGFNGCPCEFFLSVHFDFQSSQFVSIDPSYSFPLISFKLYSAFLTFLKSRWFQGSIFLIGSSILVFARAQTIWNIFLYFSIHFLHYINVFLGNTFLCHRPQKYFSSYLIVCLFKTIKTIFAIFLSLLKLM